MHPAPRTSSSHVADNERHWDDVSESYQMLHVEQLSTTEPTWAAFGIPEAELGVLGDVAGKDVVELGCGGAQFSIGLARQGARYTCVDISSEQLAFARDLLARAEAADGTRPDVTLVQGDVEALDLPDASFDLAFSDYGASMFADPARWLPEAARLLRPGGRLVFSAITPLLEVCWPPDNSPVTSELRRDYFELGRIDDYGVQFNLPYGAWIRLFRSVGLSVVDLVETRPAEGVTSTAYRTANQIAWARRWPAEMIWVLER
jgi:ubiquinone/menaquinone biosynthesis C-methylase UbiE